VVKRIRSHLPDTYNDDTEVVIELMELSEEMSELRKLVGTRYAHVETFRHKIFLLLTFLHIFFCE
jgi:hypothetical protein